MERGPGIALQAMQEKKALSSRGRGRLRGFLELRRPRGFSPEARRGSQGASRAAPGKSGLHVIHTVKGFGIVNKAEVHVFLELSCFFNDPTDVWQFDQSARRSNQSILKETSPEYSFEGLMLKLKLHDLATWCEELTHWKRP